LPFSITFPRFFNHFQNPKVKTLGRCPKPRKDARALDPLFGFLLFCNILFVLLFVAFCFVLL